MKFKVGDTVRILDGANITDYDCGWIPDMKSHIGKIYKISEIDGISARLKGVLYSWDFRGLEKVDETIVIYRKDREVIALDKSTGRKAVAQCHPSDEFDFHVGASLAFGRLLCQNVYKKVNEKSKLDMDSADGKIFSNMEQIAKDFANFKNKPMSELLGYKEKPKLYNGKVVCIKTETQLLTVGKIYEFVDGFSKYDNGNRFPFAFSAIRHFDDLENGYKYKFIEIVEEK